MHNARIYFLLVIFFIIKYYPFYAFIFAGQVPWNGDATRVLPPAKYHDTGTLFEYLHKSGAAQQLAGCSSVYAL
jgi:hypothetical protein